MKNHPEKDHTSSAQDARQGGDGRQGGSSRRILYVMILGIVLAVGAMTAVNLFGNSTPDTPAASDQRSG